MPRIRNRLTVTRIPAPPRPAHPGSRDFDQAIELFIRDRKIMDARQSTIRWYTKHLKYFRDYLLERRLPTAPAEITLEMVEDFILHQRDERSNRPESINEFISETASFIDGLVSHYVLDGGKLVVAHAGMKEEMQGRGSGKVREFALFGETTGETDEFGLPIRHNWASEYRGRAMVVYGHTPVAEAEWINNTINIDTGCVFGGKLTALRYPEKELVEVPALYTYYEPARPFLDIEDRAPSAQEKRKRDDILDIDDVLGKRIISTRLSREGRP